MKIISLYVMSLFYIIAGINHFWHPDFYTRIMPPWLPYHMILVIVSGACEIILGFFLIFRKTRKLAAWGIIILLITVFPANIQMALNYFHDGHPKFWITIVRLPLQVLLIWWAYVFTKRETGLSIQRFN